MFTATPHHPDGSPVCFPGAHGHKAGSPGDPLTYERRTEDRAILSAKKAWWHPKSLDPTKSLPPEGALIKLDGITVARFGRVPVLDPAGEVVSTTLGWVDVQAELRVEADAKALAAAKAAHSRKGPAVKASE